MIKRLKSLGNKGLGEELSRMNKMGVLFIYCVNIYVISNFISSPFLFVICDDRVIRYVGADDNTGDVVDAQTTE